MSLYEKKPFCACSTPPGVSGIAVIRLSGQNSAAVVDKCVRILRSGENLAGSSKNITVSQMGGYTCAYADFFDPEDNNPIDDVVITKFCAPYSYTGEDMVEISCHGGISVKDKILSVLVDNGARNALPGEFTKTAFLNGKLDLSQAEAVMDVINADSEKALKAANSQLNGELKKRIEKISDDLYKILARIEMAVEFPEHDEDGTEEELIFEDLKQTSVDLTALKNSYKQGRVLSERMKIALLGFPNSGKSSLLNVLSGYDRAIVTEIAGTTRDTLEVQTDIAGIPVTLVDTAGIRETEDIIEEMGVNRAIKAFEDCDMALYLISPDTSLEDAKTRLSDILKDGIEPSKITLVFSKTDAGKNRDRDAIIKYFSDEGIKDNLEISSVDNINIEELKSRISDFYERLGGTSASDVLILNRRHADAVTRAEEQVLSALEIMETQVGIDVASSVLRISLDALGEITGKTVSAELCDTIFGRFCIGK